MLVNEFYSSAWLINLNVGCAVIFINSALDCLGRFEQ